MTDSPHLHHLAELESIRDQLTDEIVALRDLRLESIEWLVVWSKLGEAQTSVCMALDRARLACGVVRDIHHD